MLCKRATVGFALLFSVAGMSGEVTCVGAPMVDGVVLPQEKLDLRKAAFEELCRKSPTLLVDASDETLQARLVLPQRREPRISGTVSSPLKPNLDAKKATVVFIVEETGKVSWLSILDSSGDGQVDNSTGTYFLKVMKYEKPGTLDGKPVRVFMTVQARIVSRTINVPAY